MATTKKKDRRRDYGYSTEIEPKIKIESNFAQDIVLERDVSISWTEKNELRVIRIRAFSA